MTNWLNVKNNAESTLASGITAVATSLSVAAGEGARFPNSNFNITIDSEILLCTTRTGDVLTVTRAQEGTTAAVHAAVAAVSLNVTAGIISQLQTAVDAAVVGPASVIDGAPAVFNGTTGKLIKASPYNLFCGYFYSSGFALALPYSAFVKLPFLVAATDPASMINVADWYGTVSAYIQADGSGCSATNIKKTGAAFPAAIYMSYIRWASNANGTGTTGTGVVTAVADANNLTIAKISGSDFANSYYFYIQHSEISIQTTGFYSMNLILTFLPTTANKIYYGSLWKYNGIGGPTLIAQASQHTVASGLDLVLAWQVELSAGDQVYATGYTIDTSLASSVYMAVAGYCEVSMFMLKAG